MDPTKHHPMTPVTPTPNPAPASPLSCQHKGCNKNAEFFPSLRERGRNASGVLFGIALCRECAGTIKASDLVNDNTFPTVKRTLNVAGQYVHAIDGIDVVCIRIDSKEAGPLADRIRRMGL